MNIQDVGDVLARVLSVLQLLPNALETATKIRKSLSAPDAPSITGPFAKLVSAEKAQLDKAMDQYEEVLNSDEYDNIEKDAYRRRAFTRTCKFLRSLHSIKSHIPHYQDMLHLVCPD